jgi:hypothetical protein
MSDPWEMTVEGSPSQAGSPFIDWKAFKAEVLSRLDVLAEYRGLGLRTAGEPNPATGKVQAHAMGRPDYHPSAFVNLRTGLYHSHGLVTETLSFWNFSLRYGRFGDWPEMLRHYADKAGVAFPRFRRTPKGWIEEAVYPYTDRAGEVLYEVVRYRQPNGRKTFRQRKPNPKGGWIYDLDGVGRVLYNLPGLQDRPDDLVWFVEGEKDADALIERGLVATTSPQGAEAAGRKYWEEGCYVPDLIGRDVVILPDNDPPGRFFATVVARTLHERGIASRILHLPDLADKGDVSDWLDQGHTIEDLKALADAAAVYAPDPEQDEPDPNRDATAADLVAVNAGTRWLWEGWLPFSVLTLLTAEPSTGKTRFCLDLTKRIVNLSCWPDGSPIVLPEGIANRVLWVAADHQHAELADAPARFGFDPTRLFLNAPVSDLYGGTELQTPEQLDDFEARIRRIKPALVIIDTVTNTSDYKSQDTSDAKRQYKPLQEIAKRTGTVVLCVTHLNVAGKTLGRRADEKTRITIRLEKPESAQEHQRRLSVALSRLSIYPPALGVTMGDAGNDYDVNPPAADAAPGERGPAPAVLEAIGFLMDRLAAGPARVHSVREEGEQRQPKISSKTLYNAVRHLQGQDRLEEFEAEGRKWWRLTHPDPPPNGQHNRGNGNNGDPTF